LPTPVFIPGKPDVWTVLDFAMQTTDTAAFEKVARGRMMSTWDQGYKNTTLIYRNNFNPTFSRVKMLQ
jgi:hypothetical protein